METYYIPFRAVPPNRSLNKQALVGAIGAIGLVIQIILGFALAGSGNPKGSAIIIPHLVIGVGGIALLAFLVSSIYRTPGATAPRLVYVLALVLTLAQVALGFSLLASPSEGVLMAHQGIAILILILLAVGGVLAARSRRKR
jgi:hypothetical protein